MIVGVAVALEEIPARPDGRSQSVSTRMKPNQAMSVAWIGEWIRSPVNTRVAALAGADREMVGLVAARSGSVEYG